MRGAEKTQGRVHAHVERSRATGQIPNKDDSAAMVWKLCTSSVSFPLGNLVKGTTLQHPSICVSLLGPP